MAPERMTDGTWNLYWIAIDPRYQRRGRGKAMLAHVQNWLTAKEARILLVETSATEDFDYVRKFYAVNGFEEEARIRSFYAAGVDKVVYWKQLPSKAAFDGDHLRNELTK
jgi:ribosomal protein S18 acetylase RimI-like enzyme